MRVLRRSRLLAAAASAAVLVPAGVATAGSTAGAAGRHCTPRILVLSAMPVEIAPLIAATHVDRTIRTDGRDYVVGRLSGHDAVLTLTGIGPVNATRQTQRALAQFRCGHRSGISALVFSGVAGGDYIGDVTVPDRWTLDAGKHFYPVDRSMLTAARRTAAAHVALERTAPAGDPACGCVVPPDSVGTVTVTHRPTIEVGGKGQTTDPFSGRALPCAPGGGDVFGCEPCILQTQAGPQTTRFATGVVPFIDPAFFAGYSTAEGKGYVAEDEETAAVAKVAAAHHLPFLGFRAVSDGGGDPLGLPGFPVQFFYYRQLAADNAALATRAFLTRWE